MLLPPWLLGWGSRAHCRAGRRTRSGLLEPVPRPADASRTRGGLYPPVEQSFAGARGLMPRSASHAGHRTGP
jgi:hypothetical protein